MSIEISVSRGDCEPYQMFPESVGCATCGGLAKLFIAKNADWKSYGGMGMCGIRLGYKCESCKHHTYYRMYGPKMRGGEILFSEKS